MTRKMIVLGLCLIVLSTLLISLVNSRMPRVTSVNPVGGFDPTQILVWYDDFIGSTLDTDTYFHQDIGTATGAVNNQRGGVYRIVTGANPNSRRETNWGFLRALIILGNPVMISRFRVLQLDSNFNIGLNDINVFGVAGDPNLYFTDGVNTFTLPLPRDVRWHTMKLEITGSAQTGWLLTLWIDGVLQLQTPNVLLSGSTEEIYLRLADNGVTVNRQMDIDYIFIYQNR